MAMSIKNVVMIAVSLMIIALILPLGLGLLANAGDTVIDATTNETLADVLDPNVITLLTVLIPILAVVGIAVAYIRLR